MLIVSPCSFAKLDLTRLKSTSGVPWPRPAQARAKGDVHPGHASRDPGVSASRFLTDLVNGGRVIPAELLDAAQVLERAGLPEPVPAVLEQARCLIQAYGGGRVVVHELLDNAQIEQGVSLPEPVA
jgi:hypothetical protein